MLIVQKFGGSSLADLSCLRRAASLAAEARRRGSDLVLVVSAAGDSTDELISAARRILPLPRARELDALLATGEQRSAALMAMMLESLGCPARSFSGAQAGIHTDGSHGAAAILRVEPERLLRSLDAGEIAVVAGFQGRSPAGDVTTLGRGGSDTTAVALAAALHADACEIYTDVDGVYTADPRYVKNARKLEEITYDEMLELATLGAGVLHNRSVEMAKKYGVQLVVRSSLNDHEGTVVKEDTMEKMLVSGVADDRNAARIAVIGLKDEPGIAFHLFNALAKYNINIDMILQSVGRDGTKDISFTCEQDEADEAVAVIQKAFPRSAYQKVDLEKRVAKISIVGAGMQTHPGVAATMFEALYDAGINIRMISTSEIRVTVLIDEKYADKAINAIHDRFSLDD